MLRRKMFRDIKKNLSQFVTIVLMVMIGVMAYSGIEAYMSGMQQTADKFYSENNLQDLNLLGEGFSLNDLELVKSIDNVKDAERKLEVRGTTDDDKDLIINFIESNNISKFYILDGEEFDVNKSGVWVDNFYAEANNLKIGDIIKIKYESLELEEKILGFINVPDHLYDVKDESQLYPNREDFGFVYMSVNEISEDFIKSKIMDTYHIDSDDIFKAKFKNFNYKEYIPFNYIMVDVSDREKINNVKNDIEDKVKKVLAIINIEDTSSYSTYQGEINEGKTYVGVFSGLFLFIACLSVITTMNRVIKNQRTLIGTLKALGFSNRKILFHYIGYGFWSSLLGVIAGLILGYYFIGNTFISLEMSFFEVPNGAPVMHASSYCIAALVVIIVSFITFIASLSILKESPAEALRNKIPSVKGKSLNITKKGIFKKLNFSSKWNLRDILRNKMRTFMGIAGVTGCCMLIVCALGMLDSMNHFIDLQFNRLYNFDYKLNLQSDLSSENLQKLENDYGNDTSKSYGIEIKIDGERESNNLFVTDAGDKIRFINNNDNYINLDSDKGVYVTYKFASINGFNLGNKITWHIYGDDTYYTSEIVGFNKDPQNQNMTMTRGYLESLGINYKPDTIYSNDDSSKNISTTLVSSVQDVESLKSSMNDMLSMMKTMLTLIIGIAIVLGMVIIYNLGILSYSEKMYQFATLKVLGFNDQKIKNIFIKQNNWIAVVAIIIGMPLGYMLTNWLFKVAIAEHYDFNAYIGIVSYICAAIGTFVISYIVSKMLTKKISKIDMVTSLKGNE